MDTGYSIDVIDRRRGAAIVELGGEVDMANAREVGEQLFALAGDESWLVLDLARLQYLDSAGLRMLFDVSERLAEGQKRLVLVVASDAPVRRVLSITKLDMLVPLHDDIGGALEAAGAV